MSVPDEPAPDADRLATSWRADGHLARALVGARHPQAARRSSSRRAARSPAPTPAASTSSRGRGSRPRAARSGCASWCRRTTRCQIDFREFTLPVDEQVDRRARRCCRGSPSTSPISTARRARQEPVGLPARPAASTRRPATSARSMLTVPMIQPAGRGHRRHPAHQQASATPRRACSSADDFDDEVMPFDERAEELALALAVAGRHLARERAPLRGDPARCSTASSTRR